MVHQHDPSVTVVSIPPLHPWGSPSSCQGLESHSASSSYQLLLIHAPTRGLPDVLTSLASSLIKLAPSPPPLGRRHRIRAGSQCQGQAAGIGFVASCLSQSRRKTLSAFCSQVCLLSGGGHSIFCNGSSHFVRLTECRINILPQIFFSFFFSALYDIPCGSTCPKKKKIILSPHFQCVCLNTSGHVCQPCARCSLPWGCPHHMAQPLPFIMP